MNTPVMSLEDLRLGKFESDMEIKGKFEQTLRHKKFLTTDICLQGEKPGNPIVVSSNLAGEITGKGPIINENGLLKRGNIVGAIKIGTAGSEKETVGAVGAVGASNSQNVNKDVAFLAVRYTLTPENKLSIQVSGTEVKATGERPGPSLSTHSGELKFSTASSEVDPVGAAEVAHKGLTGGVKLFQNDKGIMQPSFVTLEGGGKYSFDFVWGGIPFSFDVFSSKPIKVKITADGILRFVLSTPGEGAIFDLGKMASGLAQEAAELQQVYSQMLDAEKGSPLQPELPDKIYPDNKPQTESRPPVVSPVGTRMDRTIAKLDPQGLFVPIWVGNLPTNRQVLMRTNPQTGEITLSKGDGELLATYPAGTEKAQIVKDMGTEEHPLFGQGEVLNPKNEGFVSSGWVGSLVTNRQLDYGTNSEGLVIVRGAIGETLATYKEGTTKEQIQDTMNNPASLLYKKGPELVTTLSQEQPNILGSGSPTWQGYKGPALVQVPDGPPAALPIGSALAGALAALSAAYLKKLPDIEVPCVPDPLASAAPVVVPPGSGSVPPPPVLPISPVIPVSASVPRPPIGSSGDPTGVVPAGQFFFKFGDTKVDFTEVFPNGLTPESKASTPWSRPSTYSETVVNSKGEKFVVQLTSEQSRAVSKALQQRYEANLNNASSQRQIQDQREDQKREATLKAQPTWGEQRSSATFKLERAASRVRTLEERAAAERAREELAATRADKNKEFWVNHNRVKPVPPVEQPSSTASSNSWKADVPNPDNSVPSSSPQANPLMELYKQLTNLEKNPSKSEVLAWINNTIMVMQEKQATFSAEFRNKWDMAKVALEKLAYDINNSQAAKVTEAVLLFALGVLSKLMSPFLQERAQLPGDVPNLASVPAGERPNTPVQISSPSSPSSSRVAPTPSNPKGSNTPKATPKENFLAFMEAVTSGRTVALGHLDPTLKGGTVIGPPVKSSFGLSIAMMLPDGKPLTLHMKPDGQQLFKSDDPNPPRTAQRNLEQTSPEQERNQPKIRMSFA